MSVGASLLAGCDAAQRRGFDARLDLHKAVSSAQKLVRKMARRKADVKGDGRRVATSGPEAVESVLVQVVVLDDLIEEDDKRVDVAEVRRPDFLRSPVRRPGRLG